MLRSPAVRGGLSVTDGGDTRDEDNIRGNSEFHDRNHDRYAYNWHIYGKRKPRRTRRAGFCAKRRTTGREITRRSWGIRASSDDRVPHKVHRAQLATVTKTEREQIGAKFAYLREEEDEGSSASRFLFRKTAYTQRIPVVKLGSCASFGDRTSCGAHRALHDTAPPTEGGQIRGQFAHH